jgi:hypothetical protein
MCRAICLLVIALSIHYCKIIYCSLCLPSILPYLFTHSLGALTCAHHCPISVAVNYSSTNIAVARPGIEVAYRVVLDKEHYNQVVD